MSATSPGNVVGSVDFARLRLSVVKVFVRSAGHSFTSPWQMRPQRASTGSGLCIDCAKRQVLTNAHVVSDAVTVRVRRYGDPKLYPARVACVSAQCDLALLEVPEGSFWEGIAEIGLTEDTPALDSDVLTIGYPMGGDNISVTRGVVSRIDLMDYTFSPVGGERLPVIQVDAAINPGNSGGPVLGPAGRAVGVAFAGAKAGENIGYVIPGSVALFFLRGFAETGRFPGLCSLGVRVQSTENPAMRQLHGLAGEAGGVLVTDVAPISPAAKAGIKVGDTLLSIDGVSVAEDASVPYRNEEGSGERIGFDYLVTRKVVGEKISLVVGTGGAQLTAAGNTQEGGVRGATQPVELTVAPVQKLVPRIAGVDAFPSYLVVGGLVFVRLTLPWLQQRFNHVRDAPPQLIDKLDEFKQTEDEEVVVLAKVLAADVNHGYEDISCVQVAEFGSFSGDSIDGQGGAEMVKIQNLCHLRALVVATRHNVIAADPSQTPSSFLRFRLANGLEVVLDAATCEASEAEILRQHAISRECSQDLLRPEDAVPANKSRL